MEILAHRGKWDKKSEGNTLYSLIDALENGFGVETDIRDLDGEIVISHDPPQSNKCENFIKLSEFFEEYNNLKIFKPLALNVKSDGLAKDLNSYLDKYNITNYFKTTLSKKRKFSCYRSIPN